MRDRRYKKIFQDKETLDEMLKLIKQGYTYASIARRFKCDHTSVMHQAKKFGIDNKADRKYINNRGRKYLYESTQIYDQNKTENLTENLVKKSSQLEILNNEKINQGKKSYVDYLKAEYKERPKELKSILHETAFARRKPETRPKTRK